MPEVGNFEALKKLVEDIKGSRVREAVVTTGPASLVLELEDKNERTLKLVITPVASPGLCGNLLTLNAALAFHWDTETPKPIV